MRIIISNRSAIPIYEQIKQQIKDAIFAGELQEDELLPSIRQLAKDLRISTITTTRAYSDLESEGFVVNVQGKGCYILPRNMEMARENALRKIEDLFILAVSAAKSAGIDEEELIATLNLLWKEEDHE